MNSILLSFDLEEFDIPEEYGQKLEDEEKIRVTLTGLLPLLELLDKHKIVATFYTTAFFAERNKEILKQIATKHEIASHGYYHSSFKPDDVASSKEVLASICQTPVTGFRMARLAPFDKTMLVKAGYTYDSSLNPTFLPGRYNNLGKPRLPFISDGLFILPASVTSTFRVPLFWISFKNFPANIYTALAIRVLKKDKYLSLYFHPWEFADLSSYKIPGYVKRASGNSLLIKLENLLVELKQNGNFTTTIEYCNTVLKHAH